MSRSYLLRRPKDDEDEFDQELVRAKPINAQLARNLEPAYAAGKDFVKASQKSQKEFYGSQTILGERDDGIAASTSDTRFREMTHDEKNKLSASIIKAEIKGDTERVKKLKKKLEEGIVEIAKTESGINEPNVNFDEKKKMVVLMEMDRKTGLVIPSKGHRNEVGLNLIKKGKKLKSGQSANEAKKRKGTVESIFENEMDLKDMIAEEKRTTAEDQITMFARTAKVCSDSKTDDDWNLDDNMLSHPKKRRHGEKDERLKGQKQIQEHKFLERTLDSCQKCLQSRSIEKHAIVATGLKTYLAVVNWEGLSPDHCYIAPMEHCANSVCLDEDIWEEMRLWMKGLVAMWRGDDDQDCVFFENARYVREQRHMVIECVPLPREIGDMAPIYFKKAIMESEKEWSDNKKLIDLAKESRHWIRGAIPRGFPYFCINFGLQPGYAHIIEDEQNFPSNFAHEIIGGMLDLPYRQWKNPKPQSFIEVKEKRAQLRQRWMKYDWTEIVKCEIKGESSSGQTSNRIDEGKDEGDEHKQENDDDDDA